MKINKLRMGVADIEDENFQLLLKKLNISYKVIEELTNVLDVEFYGTKENLWLLLLNEDHFALQDEANVHQLIYLTACIKDIDDMSPYPDINDPQFNYE